MLRDLLPPTRTKACTAALEWNETSKDIKIISQRNNFITIEGRNRRPQSFALTLAPRRPPISILRATKWPPQ